jgi:PhnB protein
MTSRLNPYIMFDGNAREAMEFYRTVFGGELTVSTFGEFGSDDAALKDKVMHAMLLVDNGYALMGADSPANHDSGTRITVSLSGDDEDLREYFEKLSNGGDVKMPLEKQVWGDEYGQLTDKFGIEWMVNIGQTGV